MSILTTWTITEHLGHVWPRQVVWHGLPTAVYHQARAVLGRVKAQSWPADSPAQPFASGAGSHAPFLAVVDSSGQAEPAQLDATGAGVWYPMALKARESRRYDLILATAEPASPLQLCIWRTAAQVHTAGFAVRLRWGPETHSAVDSTPPLLGLCGADDIWFGASTWFGVRFASLKCEVVECGPVRVVLRQIYRTVNVARLSCTYTLDCVSPVLHLQLEWNEATSTGEEAASRGSGQETVASATATRRATGLKRPDVPIDAADPGPQTAAHPDADAEDNAGQKTRPALMLHLGDRFRPTHAFWRPHSPSAWRGSRVDTVYKRQVYALPRQADRIRLGPLYNWDKDAASFWCAWSETEHRDLLYLGCPRPARFYTAAAYQRVEVTTLPTVDVRLPLQSGRTGFTLALLDRDATTVHTQGPPCDLDRLHTQLNGPGLDDYVRMALTWPGMKQAYPCLWITAADQPAIRARLQHWEWLREAFHAHANDRILNVQVQPDLRLDGNEVPVLGQDPAGAYLATGDTTWAVRARNALRPALDRMVAALLDYGPAVDGTVGIGLARPWRALALNLDLVLGSPAFTPAARLEILRRLAFVAEVSCTDDAWPATGSGVDRGNANFHPDVVSARGLAAALLNGHPLQKVWLDQARSEMREFIRWYHRPSGMSREAATYQLCALSCALQLDAALRQRGYDSVLDEPVCKASLEFLAAVQTPPDPRCGHRLLPTVGHVTGHAWCQSLQAYFGWAARVTATSDADFSARMMAAWKRGGGFVVPLHDYLQHRIWSLPLCLLDPDLPAHDLPAHDPPDRPMSRAHDGFGVVLRCVHHDRTEGYLLMKMGECSGHFDNDEGSLVWYAYGQPLLADFGCQYNPNLHAHPWLHNRISIDHCADAPPRGGRLLVLQSVPGLDYACGEVCCSALYRETEWPVRDRDFDFRQVSQKPRCMATQVWRRHLLYVHELETVILFDQITGDLPTDWNLQVLAESVRPSAQRAGFKGSFGVDLSVLLVQPEAPRLEFSALSHLGMDEPRLPQGWWRAAAWTTPPGVRATAMAEHALTLRAHAGPNQHYLAGLVAFRSKDTAPRLEPVDCQGIRVESSRGHAHVQLDLERCAWHVQMQTCQGRRHHCLPLPAGMASIPSTCRRTVGEAE